MGRRSSIPLHDLPMKDHTHATTLAGERTPLTHMGSPCGPAGVSLGRYQKDVTARENLYLSDIRAAPTTETPESCLLFQEEFNSSEALEAFFNSIQILNLSSYLNKEEVVWLLLALVGT